MTSFFKGAVSALALSCGFAALAAPAHAYTLMDMIRGDRQRTQSTIIDPSNPAQMPTMQPPVNAPLPKVDGTDLLYL
ncbi:hypothetical protein ABIE40_002087 [Rhizobium sp. OAE497]